MSRARDLADDVVAQPVLPVEDGRLVQLDIEPDVAHLLPWNPIRLAVRLAAEAAERRETSRPRRGPSRRASAADPISIKAMRGGSPWRSSATSPSTLPIFVWRRSTSAGVTHSNIAEARPEVALSMYDVRLHVLSSGDVFDLARRRPAEMPHVRTSHA